MVDLEKRRATKARYYQNHKEENRASATRYREQLRMKVLGHYSNGAMKCAHCGEADLDVLCLDHINGGGSQQRRELGKPGGRSFYLWVIANSYPEGFQVLCANCNIRKFHKESRESQ